MWNAIFNIHMASEPYCSITAWRVIIIWTNGIGHVCFFVSFQKNNEAEMYREIALAVPIFHAFGHKSTCQVCTSIHHRVCSHYRLIYPRSELTGLTQVPSCFFVCVHTTVPPTSHIDLGWNFLSLTSNLMTYDLNVVT